MEHQDGEQDDVTTFRTSISEVISHKTIIVPGDTSSKNAILHDDEQLQSAMERVKSLSSPATLQDLIEVSRDMDQYFSIHHTYGKGCVSLIINVPFTFA
jgi:hypothetical protein